MATVEEEEDAAIDETSSALVPILQVIIAAYAANQAAEAAGAPIRTYLGTLGLSARLSGILVAAAIRAVNRLRERHPEQDFWDTYEPAERAAKATGLNVVDQALVYIGRNPAEDKTPAEQFNAEAIAEMTAVAVQTTAQEQAAKEAGLGYKTWHNVGDLRVRPTHHFLGATNYEFHTVPVGKPFIITPEISPPGMGEIKIWRPGDPAAPISETFRCRCHLTFSP